MKVLLLENISAVAVQVFRDAGYEVESLKPALDEHELIEKVSGVSILGVRSKTRVSQAVLESASQLVTVGAFCIGVDKIDQKAANERGIAVFNDPHSNSRSVAELAMGEIILLLRRTFLASTQMHQGEWNKSAAGAHAEEESTEDRDAGGEGQYREIEWNRELIGFPRIRKQRRQGTATCKSQSDAEYSAECGEQRAFRQHSAQDANASRAKGEANRNFPLSGCRPREQHDDRVSCPA